MKLKTNSERIKQALFWAQKYFDSADFYADIQSVEAFDHSNVTPSQLVELFKAFENKTVEVKLSYFGFFYKKVLGRTVGNGFAYVNSSGLDRPLWSVGATIVHEATHIVDEFFPKAYFGHGNNSPNGKSRSFPYFIDEKAENWIKNEILKKEITRLSTRKVMLRRIAI